jgi:hypothetical protein
MSDQCPRCSGKLVWAINTDTEVCRACGYEFDSVVVFPGAEAAFLAFEKRSILEDLREEFTIPAGFEDLAIEIYRSGLEANAEA